MSNISYVYGTESDKYNAYIIYRDGRRLEPQPLAEYIEKLESRIVELEAKQRWIPVGERLPEASKVVLVSNTGGGVDLNFHKQFGGWFSDEHSILITHWMPLPKPPEEYQHEPA